MRRAWAVLGVGLRPNATLGHSGLLRFVHSYIVRAHAGKIILDVNLELCIHSALHARAFENRLKPGSIAGLGSRNQAPLDCQREETIATVNRAAHSMLTWLRNGNGCVTLQR